MQITVKKNNRQLANIDNIKIIKDNSDNSYHIVCEWSRLPLESFSDLTAAMDFIDGFRIKPVGKMSDAYWKGLLFRRCVNLDLSKGIKYNKVNDLSKYIESL